MKTRENELHEPKIAVNTNSLFKGYDVIAVCSVCRKEVMNRFVKHDVNFMANFYLPNYCPNCGARLKEVGE